MAKFLALDGTIGTYASTPHSDAVDLTGDMALVARIEPTQWGGTETNQGVISKRISGQNSFYWYVSTTGNLIASVPTADGVGNYNHITTPPEKYRRKPTWFAWTISINAGGSVSQWYASEDGSIWEPLGSPNVTNNASGIPSTTAPLNVGSFQNGNQVFGGKIYRAQIYDGSGFDLSSGPTGTLVADFNAEDAPDYARGGDSFQSALTGETWTLHGNASIGGVRTVISDDMVLEPKLPRPSVCLTAMARREVRLQAVWRQCR